MLDKQGITIRVDLPQVKVIRYKIPTKAWRPFKLGSWVTYWIYYFVLFFSTLHMSKERFASFLLDVVLRFVRMLRVVSATYFTFCTSVMCLFYRFSLHISKER